MERETFVFYKKWAEAIKGLPSEIKLEIYESIIEYATTGKVPDLKMTAQIGFNFVKSDIDRDLEKYTKAIEKNRQNGKKGGRPKTQQNPLGFSQTQPNPKNLEYDNDYDVLLEKEPKERENIGEDNFSENSEPLNSEQKQKEKSSAKKEKGFTPPTIQEVQDYCTERQNGIDAENFWNFYQSKGWMVGKNKMKDWKACIITWEKTRKKENANKGNNHQQYASSTQRNAHPTNGVAVSKKISARSILAREITQQSLADESSGDYRDFP